YFFLMILPPPNSTLFPYTTLFRSHNPIQLASLIAQNKVKELQADLRELSELMNQFDPLFSESIDPGEQEALALMLAGRCPEHRFCSAYARPPTTKYFASWRATTAGTITSKKATIPCQSPSSWASMITFASSNIKGSFNGLLLKCFHFPAKLRQTDPDKLGQFRA